MFDRFPNVMNFYWGLQEMSYLQYLTLVTFHENNPDFEIIIHFPITNSQVQTWDSVEQKTDLIYTEDFMEAAFNLPYIKTSPVDFNDIDSPLTNNSPEVHKSDFLRLHILSTKGGFWSDLDILYLSPLSMGSLHLDSDIKKTAIMSQGRDQFFRYYFIGLLGAAENDECFEKIKSRALRFYDKTEYQSIGSVLYKNCHHLISNKAQYFHPALLYGFGWDSWTLRRFFFENAETVGSDNMTIALKDAVGIHWCNGNPFSSIISRYITPNTQNEFTEKTIGAVLKNVLIKDENFNSHSILQ